MNGKARDQISTDLASGRPTISPKADELAVSVTRLMPLSESEEFFGSLGAMARASPSYVEWLHAPDRFLADMDPAIAGAIERHLEELLAGARDRAVSRGWEVEG